MDNDSLYALKIYYEDEYNDEYQIIQKLKAELLNNGMTENDANNRLKEFYDSFGSNIDITVFETIQIINNDEEDTTTHNNEEDVDEEDTTTQNNEEDTTIPIINMNIGSSTFQFQVINNNGYTIFRLLTTTTDDVISTLSEEDINKLKKYVLEHNLEDKCSVCIDSMEKTQEVIELDCKHIYH